MSYVTGEPRACMWTYRGAFLRWDGDRFSYDSAKSLFRFRTESELEDLLEGVSPEGAAVAWTLYAHASDRIEESGGAA